MYAVLIWLSKGKPSYMRQHFHALQQNPLSALAIYTLLVWLLESVGVAVVELVSNFDRPASRTAATFDCAA